MAELVLGIGTSHTPMNTMPPETWRLLEDADSRRKELVSPRTYTVKPYAELLAEAPPDTAERLALEHHRRQAERIRHAGNVLAQKLREARPDVVVIVSDDQDEILFEDNMPMFMVYWGDSVRMLPYPTAPGTPADYQQQLQAAWGDRELDIPVAADLGKHLVEYLVDAEFDVAHSRYLTYHYGGSIGPAGYVWWKRETPPRPMGLPHGYTYIVKRLMDPANLVPIVPVFQNTCYPPNQPTPRRSYALGKAIRSAIEEWDSDKRVAVVASGGLSHFMLDEDTDRLVLGALEKKDAEALCSLARERLQSASSEILNWITVAGLCEDRSFHLVDYLPVVRSPAASGGGWGFAFWE